MDMDPRILSQFDELINLGQALLKTQTSPGENIIGDDRVDLEAGSRWATGTQSLLSRTFGENSNYHKNFCALTSKYITYTPAKQALGMLLAARDDYIGYPTSNSTTPVKVETLRSSKKVFVVHGRNETLRRSLYAFLRAVGLEPIEWAEAVKLTQKPAPYIGEILEAAFVEAQAVVVLLTPDDEARLREELCESTEPSYERDLTGQARPNVIFEAGMAFGRHADRTVLIELGTVRPFSDVAGRYTLKFDNSPEKRLELVDRLKIAGCPISTEGKSDWLKEGSFESPLLGRKIVQPDFNERSTSLGVEHFRYQKNKSKPRKGTTEDFDQTTHAVLKVFFDTARDMSVNEVDSFLNDNIDKSLLQYHFDLLQDANFVVLTQIGVETEISSTPPKFGITPAGRKYVVKNRL